MVGREDTTTAITVGLLVNAETRPFLHGGESMRLLHAPLDDGRVDLEVTLPPTSLDRGLNRVDVLTYIHRNGGYRLFVTPTFTIASGDFSPPELSVTEGLEERAAASTSWVTAYRSFGSRPDWGERLFATWMSSWGDVLEVPTPVTLRIQPSTHRSLCPPPAGQPDEVVVLAFRDMEPMPLGRYERIRAIVSDGEERVARFDWDTSFPDQEFHHLAIVALTGFSRPTRVEEAELAPWVRTQVVTEVFWGLPPRGE
jgi:hypothetical protein